MKSIPLFRIKTARMKAERLAKIARALGMEGKTHSNEEALVVHDDTNALAYAQPCGKFAGVLFFTDQVLTAFAADQYSLLCHVAFRVTGPP